MLRKAAGTVPGGVASLWVLSLLLLAGAYLLARAAFLKYEFPVVRARGPFG
jgi:hypothetical protein